MPPTRGSLYLWVPGLVSLVVSLGSFYWYWRFATLAAERSVLLPKSVEKVKAMSALTPDEKGFFVSLIELGQQNAQTYSDLFFYIGIVVVVITLMSFGVARSVLRERRNHGA